MHPLNRVFDKIYVVTINRNTRRHEYLKKSLIGVEYELFFGVDGKSLDLKSMDRKGESDTLKFAENVDKRMQEFFGKSHYHLPTPNVIACALSHRLVYEDIIKLNHERALVLEDDALIKAENLIYWPAIMMQLPADWDLLYLGYVWKHDETPFEGIKRRFIYPLLNFTHIRRYNHNLINHGFTEKYSQNLLTAGMHGTASAYGITNKCARLLTEEQSPIQNPADLAFWLPIMQKRVNAYCCNPRIFTTTGDASTILVD